MKIPFLKKKYNRKLEFIVNFSKIKAAFFELFEHNIEQYNSEKTVFIIQQVFYSTNGENFFSGGAERYCVDLACLTKKIGYTTVLIQIGNDLFYKKHADLDVIGVPFELFNNLEKLFNSKIKEPALSIYSDIQTAMGKIFLKNNIILSHGISWDGAERKFNLRDLKKFHTVLKKAKTFVSVDTNTINWYKATYGGDAHKVHMHYIPNYVDREQFKPTITISDNIRILFPRRAIEERGYWLVSNAIDKLMTKYNNLEFHFIGFVHKEDIRQDMNRLKALYGNKIINTSVTPEEMPQIYQNADITLIPTIHSEGTSLSCLEAMATGNAVISSNVGGLPNLIINGYNGLLINANNEELLKAVESLIINTQLRKKLSLNALDIAKEFDKQIWEQSWNKLLNNYH